ncbi:MAG: hypothetical protein J6Y02_13545, partial [Pseudobutyrivibrio sp.]|nr:hypothetical protein [Pseudobutyrivibrio sp.]
ENFTSALKSKLDGIQAQATATAFTQTQQSGTKIGSISINGVSTDIFAPQGQTITIDTQMSDSSENAVQNKVIKSYVDAAVGAVVGVEFRKVQALPQEGENGIIYLVPKSGTPPTGNIYEEWIWISADSDFEKIGETQIDLSGYVQDTDLVDITSSDIDTMMYNVFGLPIPTP